MVQIPDNGERSRTLHRHLLIAISTGILAIVAVGAVWVFREISSDKFMGGRLTTDAWSRDLPSPEERIRFLARYLKFRTQVLDCEFHIVYHDNGFAPSDWAIFAAVRVARQMFRRGCMMLRRPPVMAGSTIGPCLPHAGT